jgi:hypothetical protein
LRERMLVPSCVEEEDEGLAHTIKVAPAIARLQLGITVNGKVPCGNLLRKSSLCGGVQHHLMVDHRHVYITSPTPPESPWLSPGKLAVELLE